MAQRRPPQCENAHITQRRPAMWLVAVLLWAIVGCAGRTYDDDSGGINSGQVTLDATVGDGPSTRARLNLLGASVASPHACMATLPKKAEGWFQVDALRCQIDPAPWTGAVSAPAGAVIVAETSLTAIQAAIAKAGTGGVVAFVGGKTYELCAPISPLKGQRWTRSGAGAAIFKRCDAVTTTLANASQAGATAITVADPSKFPVDSQLTVITGAGAQTTGSPRSHRVTSVSGSSLTLTPSLAQAYPSGAKVISAFALVEISHDDVQIERLTFDGSSGKNAGFLAFETFQSVVAKGATNVRISHNAFRDSPADHVTLQGCIDCEVSGNHMTAATGAFVALQGTHQLQMNDNRWVGAKAATGAIRWGGDNLQVQVARSCLSDTTGPAFGQPLASDVGLRFADNGLLRVGGVLTVGSPSGQVDAASHLAVVGNFGVSVGPLTVGRVPGDSSAAVVTATTPRWVDVEIGDNKLLGGSIEVHGCRSVRVTGNRLAAWSTASAPDGTPAPIEPDKPIDGGGWALMALRGLVDARIGDNLILGGQRGLQLEQRAAGGSRNVTIDNNMLLMQRQTGTTLGDVAAMTKQLATATAMSAITLRRNTVSSTLPDGGSTPWAVTAAQGTHVLGNCIQTPNGVRLSSGNGDGPTTTMLSNSVVPTATSVGMLGDGTGLIVTQNWLDGAVSKSLLNSKKAQVGGNVDALIACIPCWPSANLWQQLPALVEVTP
ncbi:MAG: hypothetical protein KC502_01930 [Myxococcales bacterium]|nr:hypothetical protein [Myxococcales bacterium]